MDSAIHRRTVRLLCLDGRLWVGELRQGGHQSRSNCRLGSHAPGMWREHRRLHRVGRNPDDQFTPLVSAIKVAIGELGGEAPIFLLYTHHHGNHMGANPEFDEGATISHFPPTRFPRSRSTIP